MINSEKTLSVAKAANLLGISRGTINYWIRTNKIHANRSGKNYSMPVGDLLLYLKSSGRDIPPELEPYDFKEPIFKSFQYCWEYWNGSDHGQKCKDCVAFVNQLDTCFITKESSRLNCGIECHKCNYYRDMFLPRIHFIYQIKFPAAVYKGMYFFAGNTKWAQLCEVSEKDLPGMGIETIIHPDSLEELISNIKNGELGEIVPITKNVFLKSKTREKLRVSILNFPLNEPSGAFIILAKPEDGSEIKVN